LRALHAAAVGRNDRDRLAVRKILDDRIEQLACVEMHRAAAKRVLECREIVDLQHHHAIRTRGLEKLGDIFRRDGIARLGLPVLARIGEIRRDRAHAGRAVLLAGGDEEQQLHELVVGRSAGRAVQAVHDIDIFAAHAHERTGLVLAILEVALFMGIEIAAKCAGDRRTQFFGAFQSE